MDAAGRVIFASFFLPFMNKQWGKIGISIFPKGPLDFFSFFVDDALKNRKEVNGQFGYIVDTFFYIKFF